MDRREQVDCPICGFQLSGNKFSGYRCVKCHAHYSARFVAQVRRARFRELIDKHFGQAPPPPASHAGGAHAAPAQPPKAEVTEADDTIIIEDRDDGIKRALEEARSSVRKSIEHLETVLEQRRAAEDAAAGDETSGAKVVVEIAAIEDAVPPETALAQEQERSMAATPQEQVMDVPGKAVTRPQRPAHQSRPMPPGRVVRKLPNPATAGSSAKGRPSASRSRNSSSKPRSTPRKTSTSCKTSTPPKIATPRKTAKTTRRGTRKSAKPRTVVHKRVVPKRAKRAVVRPASRTRRKSRR